MLDGVGADWNQLPCDCVPLFYIFFQYFLSNPVWFHWLTHHIKSTFSQDKNKAMQKIWTLYSHSPALIPDVSFCHFSVDYSFWGWHFSARQWLSLWYDRWFGAKHSFYFFWTIFSRYDLFWYRKTHKGRFFFERNHWTVFKCT